ncbi:hypothetical protein INR49_016568 [Caranx melampygus]|nr:hypothetical protein INR49_016568 [Caranx melampygus]
MYRVSYFATCSCLTDRQRFPSFFRTIPSDAFQVRAIIQILKHFGWTWVGLLVSADDYGLHVAQSFQADLGPSGGGCLAYIEILPWSDNPAELSRIVNLVKTSTARVVMAFAHEIHMIQLMEEVVRQDVTGLQWVASEAWTTFAVLHTPRLMPYLGGTLGIAIRRGEIPGLKEFLLHIRPEQHESWIEAGGALCSGQETLESVETDILDLSNLRPEYNIYKAVYSLAYALDNMLQCEPGRGPFRGNSCATLETLEPWQPPRSVCSESCPPGTRMARKKGNLNVVSIASPVLRERSAMRLCTSCPEDFWSSPQRDHCVPKKTEFLSYHEPLGICLTTASLLGTLICAVVLGIFIYHRSTPMSKQIRHSNHSGSESPYAEDFLTDAMEMMRRRSQLCSQTVE